MHRWIDKQRTPTEKIGMGSDKHCASMLLLECLKSIGDFILFACAFDLNFYAKRTRRIVQIFQLIVEERIVGVQKHTNQLNLWSELMQEAKPANGCLSFLLSRPMRSLILPPDPEQLGGNLGGNFIDPTILMTASGVLNFPEYLALSRRKQGFESLGSANEINGLTKIQSRLINI